MQEDTGGVQREGAGQVEKREEGGRRRDSRGERSELQKLGRHTHVLRSTVIFRKAAETGVATECRERRDSRRMARQRRE